jgi:hypothetical protein
MYDDLPGLDGIPNAPIWTAEEYDRICDAIESGDKCTDTHGIRRRCIFNSLEAFHCIGSFPFDAMHDWHEKVAATDGQSVILALVRKGTFSLESYNDLLTCLKLKSYECADRPLPLKLTSEKICGKAMSVNQHLRLMPLLVHELVGEDEEDDLIDLLLLLHQLNELIMSDALEPGDIPEFESLLVEYFEKRKSCHEQNPGVFQKLTPKPHFLEHYPTQAVRFGPNLCVGTARYEGKHRQFVGWSDASKNFINVVKTISTRHQKRLASKSLYGMFSAPDIQFPPKTSSKPSCGLPVDLFHAGRVNYSIPFFGFLIEYRYR